MLNLTEVQEKLTTETTELYRLVSVDEDTLMGQLEGLDEPDELVIDSLLKESTTLALPGRELSANGARNLAKVLKKYPITSLILSDNTIKDQGVSALAEVLRDHPILTTVNLSKNEISDRGARILVKALKDNHVITALILDDNPISQYWLVTVRTLLSRNIKLPQTLRDAYTKGLLELLHQHISFPLVLAHLVQAYTEDEFPLLTPASTIRSDATALIKTGWFAKRQKPKDYSSLHQLLKYTIKDDHAEGITIRLDNLGEKNPKKCNDKKLELVKMLTAFLQEYEVSVRVTLDEDCLVIKGVALEPFQAWLETTATESPPQQECCCLVL